jgi:hypothetical protein
VGLHTVGNPNDYGGDDDPPTHGRDTAVYQELQPVRELYRLWLSRNRGDLFNDELEAMAQEVEDILLKISDELNTPL